jgi:hypothetical protein
MEKPHKAPITKTNALAALGVHTKKANRRLSAKVELVNVNAARRLVKRGEFLTSVMVVLDGSVSLQDAQGHTQRFEAPFAIDFWAADEARVSIVEAVAETDATLLLVDWSQRDVVLTAIPRVRRLSKDTQKWFETITTGTIAEVHPTGTRPAGAALVS